LQTVAHRTQDAPPESKKEESLVDVAAGKDLEMQETRFAVAVVGA
jgi:hypothetical protein